MKRHLLTAVFLLCMLSACEERADIGADGRTPVAFSVKETEKQAPAATRAGELTSSNITSMGVFAYYTGQNNWNAATDIPNFMYNERVGRTNSTSPWTYEPVKYWPNTAGDKLTFFAYAPHTTDMTKLSVSTGAGVAGYPKLYYDLPVSATSQTDLLAAAPLKDKTKGTASLAFAMKHVLTRVLVNVKCEDAITVTKVEIKGNMPGYGTLTWDGSGSTVWTYTSSMSSNYATSTNVPANAANATQVAEFFLFPKTPSTDLVITYSLNGSSETKSVAIPSTPAWTMGQAIAYTLNIDTDSKITLSVKTWDTNTPLSGTVGEDAPTTYPSMRNGIIYESPTKSYYVGPIDGSAYLNWHQSRDKCQDSYSYGSYGFGEWRLPSGSELRNIGKFSLGGETYVWAFEEASSTEGYLYRLTAGGILYEPPAKFGKGDYRGLLICVRDLGDLTYPTMRKISDELLVVHESANKSYYVGPTKSGYSGGQGGYYNWHECHRICNNEYSAGPFPAGQWRLPTLSEIDAMRPYGFRVGTWIYASEQANGTEAWLTKIEKTVWKRAYGKGDYRAQILCVRDY